MVARYIWTDEKMFDADDGDFVTYADHQRETAQLQARVAELEAALFSREKAVADLIAGMKKISCGDLQILGAEQALEVLKA